MQVSFGTLEAKVLGEQGTNGLGIVFNKWIKTKSRRSDHLSYPTGIRNKSSFYYEKDT